MCITCIEIGQVVPENWVIEVVKVYKIYNIYTIYKLKGINCKHMCQTTGVICVNCHIPLCI